MMLVLLVMGIVLGGVLIAVPRPDTNAPALTTSCTNPAAAVKALGDNNDTVTYAVTGPADGTYVVTIDAKTAVARGSGADVTPSGAIAVSVRKGLKSCKTTGTLPPLPNGPHELVVFRDATVVARAGIPG